MALVDGAHEKRFSSSERVHQGTQLLRMLNQSSTRVSLQKLAGPTPSSSMDCFLPEEAVGCILQSPALSGQALTEWEASEGPACPQRPEWSLFSLLLLSSEFSTVLYGPENAKEN